MIIGLSGYARSGKDTVANFLVENHGFTRLSFAEPMREALLRLNPTITVAGVQGVVLSSVVKSLGWERLKELSPDVRGLLQRLGTEVGREMFGENFWVDYLINKALDIKGSVVISDVRYLNEADSIKLMNGQIWRVNRPNVEAANSHPSEIEMDSFNNFDVVITNDTSLDELFLELTGLMNGITSHNGS